MIIRYSLVVLSFLTISTLLLHLAYSDYTLILKYCSPAINFWLSEPIFNPYNLFTLILALLLVWAAIELVITTFSKRQVSNLLAAGLLAIVLVYSHHVHFKLYQTLLASEGQLYYFDIWPDSEVLILPSWQGTGDLYLPSWFEYKHTYSCSLGLLPYALSKEQLRELNSQYDLIHRNYYKPESK